MSGGQTAPYRLDHHQYNDRVRLYLTLHLLAIVLGLVKEMLMS